MTRLIIKGENLKVLYHLLPEYQQKVKLIYIDPPYNTGKSKFDYDDNRKHEEYLNFIRERLIISKEYLRDDGCIIVSCDDYENHYLRVLLDEVYGRENFLANLVVDSAPGGRQAAKNFATQHSYAIVYQKSSAFKLKHIPRTPEQMNEKYKFSDDYGRYDINELTARGHSRKVTSLTYPIYYNLDTKQFYLKS